MRVFLGGISKGEFNNALKSCGEKLSKRTSYEEVKELVYSRLSCFKPTPALDKRCIVSCEVGVDYEVELGLEQEAGVIRLNSINKDLVIQSINSLRRINTVNVTNQGVQDEDSDFDSDDEEYDEEELQDEEFEDEDEYEDEELEDDDEIEDDGFEAEDEDEYEEELDDEEGYEEEVEDEEDDDEFEYEDDEIDSDDDDDFEDSDEEPDDSDEDSDDEFEYEDDEVESDDDDFEDNEEELDEFENENDIEIEEDDSEYEDDFEDNEEEVDEFEDEDEAEAKESVEPAPTLNKGSATRPSKGNEKIQFSDLSLGGSDSLDFINNIVNNNKKETTEEDLSNHASEVSQSEESREDLPANPIEYLRKHPRALESEVKNYYSPKDVDKYINRGLIQRSRGRLFI